MDFQEILAKLKKTYISRKTIDFSDLGVQIELENITAEEDLKVLEACKDLDGTMYLDGIKRHSLAMSIRSINGTGLPQTLVYKDEKGQTQETTRYLYILKQIESWPSSLIDFIFEAYADLIKETENRIKKEGKFERLALTTSPTVEETEAPDGFKKVSEDAGLTDVEKMNKRVEKEIADADAHMAQTEQAAVRNSDRGSR